jgi:low temperature requirement protein LtrA
VRILAHSGASGVLYIAGAVIGGAWLAPLWIAGLVLDYAGPYLRYWTPTLGRSSTEDWGIDGGHFAERFHLLIIIALGESIVVTGATASDVGASVGTIAGITVAFLTTAAMWWLYFDFVAERSRERLHRAKQPGVLARDAYTYLHLPIVLGIILAAVSDELLIAHPFDPYEVPLIATAGPVCYLLGHTAFRWTMTHTVSSSRIIASIVLMALTPLALVASALVMSALVLVVLCALIVREHFMTVPALPAGGVVATTIDGRSDAEASKQ